MQCTSQGDNKNLWGLIYRGKLQVHPTGSAVEREVSFQKFLLGEGRVGVVNLVGRLYIENDD